MRRPAFAILASLFVVAGCCGSLEADRSKLSLPRLEKAMDRVHAEIAARSEGRLYAGAAMVDITPAEARTDEGIYLGGFDLGRKSTGVRDPVYAHALYLDDGRAPFVIVSIDTIGYMRDDVLKVRELASDGFRDRIVVASVHDHVGPDTVGYWGSALGILPMCTGFKPEYKVTLRHQIAQAIDQAAAAARPARVRAGTAMAPSDLSLNINAQIRDQKDDRVRVLSFDGEDGSPIAVVANWGCHAEAMWNDTLLSADWPGVFYDRWRKDVGGVPIFVEGALGGLVSVNPGPEKMKLGKDIDDVFENHMPTADRVALRDRIGNAFADVVKQAVATAGEPAGPAGVTIDVASSEFELRMNNWVFEYMGIRKMITRKAVYHKNDPWMLTEVLAARIREGSRTIADLLTVPGEPAPPVVEELDATSDAPVKLNVALGSDEIGYIVREADWDLPQYEYTRTMSLGKTTATEVIRKVVELRARLPKGDSPL